MTTPVTPEELLLKAADNITKYGHRKGDFGSPEEGFCAMGAVRYALCGSVLADATAVQGGVYKQTRTLLADSIGTLVPPWNDADETTGEDVILAMKRAAHHDS